MKKFFNIAIFALLTVLLQTGCGPSYPKDIVDEALIQMCREEYDTDIKVRIIDSTVGIYLPVRGLLDATLNISEEAAETINDVMLSASRVTLSTDAPLDFYILIAQDPLLPEIEVVLIRYVGDLKMLHYSGISRGEFGKRMIIDMKLTPQAQKEKVLRDIFTRLNIDDPEDLIREYLKIGEVVSIGDIGYWNNTFFMKDIGMGEFLGMQIADRVKAKFAREMVFEKPLKLNSINGEYLEEGGKAFFRVSFDIIPSENPAGLVSGEDFDKVYSAALDEAAAVTHGYKFNDFWNVEIVNISDDQVLFAAKDELEEYRQKRMELDDFRRWYK